MIRITSHASVLGEAVTYNLRDVLAERAPRRLDRLSELAVFVAAQCKLSDFTPERAAVFFSTGQGNFSGTTAFLSRLHDKGARMANPIEFPNLVLSAPAGTLSMLFGIKGELLSFNHGAVFALWSAYECLQSGRADVALIVGAEEQSEARTRCAEQMGERLPLQEGAGAIVLDRRASAGPMLRVGSATARLDADRRVSPRLNAIIDAAEAAARPGSTLILEGGMAALIETTTDA